MRNIVKIIYWASPFIVFRFLLVARNSTRISKSITFHRSNKIILVKEVDKSTIENLGIYVAKRTRLHLYFKGIRYRLNQISEQYLLSSIPSIKEGSGWIVDIGANIGEFSLAVAEKASNHNFLLIEPSKSEMFAACKNLQSYSAHFVSTALWNEERELLFYHANETGDSSLLPADLSRPSEVIHVRTLDSLISEFQITEIDVLKVEAEGAEPEILEGASQALRISKYVTADLGPERGVGEARTYEECRAILVSAGFVEIARFPGGRETYLFRNRNFHA
jgi:FkbM family methyltransferase